MHLFMRFTNRRGFLKAGSVAVLLGVIINYIGMNSTPDNYGIYAVPGMTVSNAYLVYTLGVVSIGLILIGLILVFVGMIRAE